MSFLAFQKKQISGIPAGKASAFPAMRDPIPSTIESRLGEDDNLFINYGMFSDSLPYRMIDDYDLGKKETLSFRSAVLENAHLRAEFVLDLGGRLWSLYDKDRKRELFTSNREFRPCNLAIRNAWFAGGVEWNCGRRGHDVNTCSPRFACELDDPEYGKVLRIYDFSEDRGTPYQLDFFLPEDSHFLFLRARIFNPSQEVVPMYFWSNMALDMTPGCRVVVPAMETYANLYDGGSHFITKMKMPDGEGFDQTYPENFKIVRDHFYNIPDDHRKYESLFDRSGFGFLHLSTRRLQGRKLFVWGDTTGGHHWQRKLLAEGMTEYLELQAGLAKTQQECLPMPPRTAWEWLEAYGGVQTEPEKIFGSWPDAVRSVTKLADSLLPEEKMNGILAETKERIALKKGVLRVTGSAAAALEELRAGEKLLPHLDFGNVSEEQQDFVTLFRDHFLPETDPETFPAGKEWTALLEAAPRNWKTHYHLSLRYFHRNDSEKALLHAEEALRLKRNAWTLHARANAALRFENDPEKCVRLLEEAVLLPEADAYLVKETMKLTEKYSPPEKVIDLYEKLSAHDRKRPMVRMLYASALFRTGNIAGAKAILLENGGLELPDAREGAIDISNLYTAILKAEGETSSRPAMPEALDYRTK